MTDGLRPGAPPPSPPPLSLSFTGPWTPQDHNRNRNRNSNRNSNHIPVPDSYLGLLETVERIYESIEGHEHEAKELDDDDEGKNHDHGAEILAVVGSVSHALLGD